MAAAMCVPAAQLADRVRELGRDELVHRQLDRRGAILAAGRPARAPTTPASARDNIAAGPIAWNDNIRNSSPKPGDGGRTAAPRHRCVRSRGEMPVPPVTSTTSQSRASRATSSRSAWAPRPVGVGDDREARGSPAAAAASSAFVRPAVRLSEAVTIATRTSDAAGACERWCPAGEDEMT
jgi:hypothetical protein